MSSFISSIFKQRFFAIAIAGVIILLLFLWLVQKLLPGELHSDLVQIDTQSQAAGEITARYLDEGSQVVLISYPDLNETLAKQAEAFKAGLLQGKMTLIATEVIQPSSTPGKEPFTLTELLRIQQSHPTADALISLIGAPRGKLYKPDSALPLIVALNSEPMENAEQLFNLGIVQMALIPDLFSPPASDLSTTNTNDSPYMIITAENVRSVLR